MVLSDIEQLLKKYDNGETTLEEEAQIRVYFETAKIPVHLEPYKLLFSYVAQAKQEQFTKHVMLKPKRRGWYRWMAAAAVVVILLGGYWQMRQMNQKITLDDLTQEQLSAYNHTLEVFNLVSSKLNKGTTNLNALNLVSSKLNEGAENMAHIETFNKTTNKIIKRSN